MPQTTRREKYEFADGMRAVAALLVALLHATTFTGALGAVDRDLPFLATAMEVGNYAVPAFIVLSGYVLMLPVSRGGDYRLRGGFWRYIGRRARRILPPYYASLVVFGALIALIPVLQQRRGTAWDNKIPVTWEGVLAHLALVHNWNPAWVYQINGPAWSVATEWHIYFLLPLVLLPLCRWLSPGAMLIAALAAGPVITFAFPLTGPGNYWLIGLFAFGMLAAMLTVRPRLSGQRWFGPAALVTLLVAIGWMVLDTPDDRIAQMASDTLAGLAVALGLVSMGRAAREGRVNLGRRVFEWRPLVAIGLWSYSIYLIHSPLLALANLLLLPLGLPTAVHWVVMVIVALPVALGASYLFFLAVERHFTTSHQKRELADLRESAGRGEPFAGGPGAPGAADHGGERPAAPAPTPAP